MKRKYVIITILITILIVFITVPKSNAALQSNGNAGITMLNGSWLLNIRRMEALGGGMGLTESIQANLTPTTPSNNLDVHMEKNSEYGAMAILSSSSYGNPNKIVSGGTTTGNKTGIYIPRSDVGEYIAAANTYATRADKFTICEKNNFYYAVGKYKTLYDYSVNSVSVAKGDACSETSGWHGGDKTWYTDWTYDIIRGTGSVFGFQKTYHDQSKPSRAAMVCGEGI